MQIINLPIYNRIIISRRFIIYIYVNATSATTNILSYKCQVCQLVKVYKIFFIFCVI